MGDICFHQRSHSTLPAQVQPGKLDCLPVLEVTGDSTPEVVLTSPRRFLWLLKQLQHQPQLFQHLLLNSGIKERVRHGLGGHGEISPCPSCFVPSSPLQCRLTHQQL